MNKCAQVVCRMAVLFSAVLLMWCIAAQAQTFRGTILGTVTDQSGAAVGGATVTIRNLDTGLTRTTTTSDDGSYTVPELPIGNYSVTVEKSGFKTVVVTGAKVEVSVERRADFTLQPGEVAEKVEVSADTLPLVESTSNTLGGTITAADAANIPVNGRDYTKLIFMTPGIAGSPDQITDSPGSFGVFSANGARGRSNNFLIDGTDMNDGYRNDPAINEAGVFGTPATILPVDAVAELRVLSNFEPEYGRNAGAVINIVTKSGSNDWHGSAIEYFRNNALDARNYFNTVPNTQTAFRNNQFGGSLGGPIVRDRTFFYVNYEGQRERVGLNSLACVPVGSAADGSLSPTDSTNSVIQALLARHPWPAPNIAGGGCPNASVTTPASNDLSSVIVKLDQNFSRDHLLTGRYFYGHSDQSFPLALLAGNVLPGFNTLTPTTVHLASISYVWVLSPTQVNEVRFGYNQFFETFFPEDKSFDPGSIGLDTGATGRDTGLPFIRVRSGIASLGANLSLPRGRTDTNWQYIDNFSWKVGRHDFKFGYEFRRTSVDGFFDAGYRGRIDFATLGDFLAGTPTGGRAALGNSDRLTFQNSHAWYAQDSFRITRRLTLNYGLRWDYYGVIGEDRGLLSNFDRTTGLHLVGSPGLPRLYNRDLNNFGPRVSVAYDLTGKGKTVIRAGWGMFYDVFSQDFFAGQLPFNTFNPGPAYNPIGTAAVLFSFSVDPGPLNSTTPVFNSFSDSDVFSVDRNARTPYYYNYNLNIQQELSKYAVLQVGYVGSQGHKLFRYRDINQPVNPAVSTARPFDNGPFAPSGGTFFYVNQIETSSDSKYHSLQVSFRARNWHGLDSTVNYVWSHSIDNASDGQDFVANATQPDNSNRPDLERGNSNFDIRNRFVWLLNYAFPKRKGSWSRLTDGWGVSSAVTVQSGQPFHLVFFDDFNGTGEFFPRPDLVGDPFAGTHSPDAFLNLAAFEVPCTFQAPFDGSAASCNPATFHFGNLGRNSLRGPDYRQWDLSIYKDTKITERLKVQFRAEFFNTLNHPNFASPLLPGFAVDASTNGIDPVTGRGIGSLPLVVTGDVGIGNPFLGGGGPRGIQLAVKFTF